MAEMDSRIKGKDIVIWGIGALQSDLEGILSLRNILYYVDDDLHEENTISVSGDSVYSSEKLKDERQENLLVIICTDYQDDAIAKLKTMGYKEENYILGQELLADASFYHEICAREISIWGTGRMYSLNEDEIHQHLPEITRFIVTEKQENTFQGKEVLSFREVKERGLSTYVVVASAYYKEIYRSLTDSGRCSGRDFIHLETFLAMCSLSKGIDGEFQFDDRCQTGVALAKVCYTARQIDGCVSREVKHSSSEPGAERLLVWRDSLPPVQSGYFPKDR